MTLTSTARRYLLISDFDQTLSFRDFGRVLSELLPAADFLKRTAGLTDIYSVEQGAELPYLLLHDPDFGRVRREHLFEVGKRLHLKKNIDALSRILTSIDSCGFDYYAVSAALGEVIQSALACIAGYGKVRVVDRVRASLAISPVRIVYVAGGSSGLQVMLHLNRLSGLTIAAPYITGIARRTVLSDDAPSVFIPILEESMVWASASIRGFFDSHAFALRKSSKPRADSVALCPALVETAIREASL